MCFTFSNVEKIAHIISQRKGRGEERVAKLQDSPDCPEREATYIISNGLQCLLPSVITNY